jgi:hypothetical protein
MAGLPPLTALLPTDLAMKGTDMRPGCTLANVVMLCSPLFLVSAAGCPWGGLPDLGATISLDEAMDSESFVGGNDERLVFVSTDYEGLPTVTLWDLITGSVDVSSIEDSFNVLPTIRASTVDLGSLEVTPLSGVSIDTEWGSLSDGRWLAWTSIQDAHDDAIHVLDLDSGTQTEYFAGYGGSLWTTALENGRLILGSHIGPDMYVIVVDLASGQASLLPTEVTNYDQLAVHGDWLAMSYEPPLDPPPASVDDLLARDPTQSANIDVINLATGEHVTITGVDSYPSLALTDTQVLWTRFDDPVTTVRAQDLAGGQMQDLLTFTEANDESVYIEDAGAPGIILNRSAYPDDFSSHELYELHTPDGRTITILDYTYGESWDNLSPIWPSMRFVGQEILYRDPDTRDWVLFDPTTGDRRTVRPFGG